MILIPEPFKTAIDVTSETPVCEIPDNYKEGLISRLKAKAADATNLEVCLEELSLNPNAERLLFSEIHRTVSHHDDHVVNIAFHAALSAYAKPLNLALKAESGSGKTYSTTQTILLFPQEDVFYIASQSPKVISHEHGEKKTADGIPFDEIAVPQKPEKSDYPESYAEALEFYRAELKKYRELEENAYYEVDLRRKIIVFLEGVNPETFKMLKTTMSRDNEENGFVDHKYVDDKGRVHRTRLIGAPTLIFNSLDSDYVAEFATRCLTATPSTSRDKITAAMEISNKKSSFPWQYEKDNFNQRLIREYIRRVRDTIQRGKIGFVNPFLEVFEVFNKEQTRAMRDFNKYLDLLAPFAMFKLFRRPIIVIHGKRYLVPTVQDALDAKAAFDAVLQTTQTGTEQRIISFYFDVVSKFPAGATAEELADAFNSNKKKKTLTVRRIHEYLDRLARLEWVDEREHEHENVKGYVDRRYKLYIPNKKCGDTAIFETATDLKATLENGFKNWLKTIAEIISPDPPIIIPRIDGSAFKITFEEFQNIVSGETQNFSLGPQENISALLLEAESDRVQENKPDNAAKKENAASLQNSKVLFYRKLAPNENQRCDGEREGGQCPLLASYEMTSSDNPQKPCYCISHFEATRKTCRENGFTLEEIHGGANEEAS